MNVSPARGPDVDARRATLLASAASVLAANPAATMGDVAAAARVGRTTLHRHFTRREDLLEALALHAMDLLAAAVAQARPDDGPAPDVLRRLAVATLPLAHELRFLEAGPQVWSLPALLDRWYRISAVLEGVVARGKRDGDLRPEVPTVLLVELLVGGIWAVGEAIGEGRIAAVGAADAVVDVVLDGAAARAPRAAGGTTPVVPSNDVMPPADRTAARDRAGGSAP